jgi:CSLREA domain-containing protein
MRDPDNLSKSRWAPGARCLLAAALAAAALGPAAVPAAAATVVVNSGNDAASSGSCSSVCTLRDAVLTANTGDTIQVPAITNTLSRGVITVTQMNLNIVGAGARGGGGSNFTGSYSGTQAVVPCPTPLPE